MLIDVYALVEWLGVIYYGVTFVWSMLNLKYANDDLSYDRRKFNRALLNLILIMMAILSLSYIGLEIDWILSGYGEEIGDFIDMLWVTHEYFVATVYVIVNLFISSHIKWRKKHDE